MRSLIQSSAGLPKLTPFMSSLSPHIAMNTTSLSDSVPPLDPATAFSHRTTVNLHTPSTTVNLSNNRTSFFNISTSSAILSSHAKDRVAHAIQNSWSKTTLKRYTGAIQQYIDFCIKERVLESLRFPADKFVLCAFAASSAGKHTGNTPRACLSAIKAC